MKKIILACIIFASVSISASAQQNITTLNYSMALGLGKTGDFVSKYSFRGFNFQYRHFYQPNVGVGIDMGWNTFYQEVNNGSYTDGTATVTGDQWRYYNSFPMLVSLDYYGSPDQNVNPYGGLGLGVEYNIANVNLGVYSIQKDAWPFALSPEAGVLIKAGNGTLFNLGIKYIYGFKTKDLPADSHLMFNVGFAFGE